MVALWVRDNVPNNVGFAWLKSGGGLFTRAYPSAWRFNAGQKIVFWIVILGGLAMSVSGLMLLFPFSAADVNGMQLTQIVIGVLFIAAILAHIYIGSLGMEGAFDAMGTGEVDLAWARAHHDLWVDEQLAKTMSGPQSGFPIRFLCVLIRRSFRVASRERTCREINWIGTGHCEQYC